MEVLYELVTVIREQMSMMKHIMMSLVKIGKADMRDEL